MEIIHRIIFSLLFSVEIGAYSTRIISTAAIVVCFRNIAFFISANMHRFKTQITNMSAGIAMVYSSW